MTYARRPPHVTTPENQAVLDATVLPFAYMVVDIDGFIRVGDGVTPGGVQAQVAPDLKSFAAGKGAGLIGVEGGGTVQQSVDQLNRIDGLTRTKLATITPILWAAGAVVQADGLAYRRVTGSTAIPDLPGWEPADDVINTRHFGVLPTGDSTAAMQAAFAYGKPMRHDIYCNVSAKLTRTGGLVIIGAGKGKCGINWTQGGATEGIKVTRSAWTDYVKIEGMDLVPSGAGLSDGIDIDNDAISGSAVDRSFFDARTSVRFNRIGRGLGLPYGWKNGVICRFPLATEVSDNEIYGYTTNGSGALLPAHFVTGSIGVSVPDQAVRTLANFQLYRNIIFGFYDGAKIYNVEGSNAESNDFQVCYDGLSYINVITKVNQYRIRFNHLGVSNCQFRVINARQLLFVGNEVSYRNGRTDGGTATLIELNQVYSFSIVGNSIRGNVSNDTDIIVDGIKMMNVGTVTAGQQTREGVISGNNFQNLHDCLVMPVESGTAQARAVIISQNTRDGIRGKFMRNPSSGLLKTSLFGVGDFELTAVTSSAIHAVNMGAPAMIVDRQDSDGGAIVMQRNGVIVGTVSTTASATAYNTTSDERLKEGLGIVSGADARAILQDIVIRNYRWIATGEQSIGAFAQELYQVYPDAVTPGHGEPGEPNFMPWVVDYSRLIPLLIAALIDPA